MRLAMVVDTNRCVGCKDCVVACMQENRVPEGYCRDWVTEETQGTYPDLSLEIRSERCNHCEVPPCVYNCPTGAMHVDYGGIVISERQMCTGCASCITACPYAVGFINPKSGCSDKCTFCLHRVKDGLLPACVSVCPTNCLHFGDLDDRESSVSVLLRTRRHKVLLPEAGTGPKLFFLLGRPTA